MKPRRRLTAIAALAGAAGAALTAGLLLAPNASAQGETLWTNPNTQAADWVAENPGDSRATLIDERIAQTPAGTWFAVHNPGEIQSQVASVVSQAAADGAAPVMVVYNIPDRDCGGHSGGGAPSHSAYRDWIDQFAAGLSGPAYIIVEPDTLPHPCAGSERDQSLIYAVQALKGASSQAHVYLDIGNSDWLSPSDAASRLQGAGIQYADGFALNTSNYRTTEESTSYAHQIQNIVGSDKGAVIDTSRNGNGPTSDAEWCDPPGRAIGQYPTTSPGLNGIDALLWVKLPGEADGCAGSAGQFIPDLAYELAQNAGSDWPGDIDPTDPGTTDDVPDDPSSDDPTGDPGAACTAELVVVNDWGSGWQADVHITAGSASIDSWTLTWDWPSGQSVSSSWNVDLSQSGSTVTADDVGWNGSISSNETRNAFGFIGSGQSAVPAVECTA